MSKDNIPWETVGFAEGGKDRALAWLAYDKDEEDVLLQGSREIEMRLKGCLLE